LGLLPRSRRVGEKGKHRGSKGLYPASAVRRIHVIKSLMDEGMTLEDIRHSFIFFRGQLDGVERSLDELFAALEKAIADEGERPCPYVSCKYNLYVDVNPRTGSVKMNFPDKELWELAETCALDVADRAGITLEEVGVIMNLTRERVRQLEMRGLAKLRVIADDEPRPAADDDDE